MTASMSLSEAEINELALILQKRINIPEKLAGDPNPRAVIARALELIQTKQVLITGYKEDKRLRLDFSIYDTKGVEYHKVELLVENFYQISVPFPVLLIMDRKAVIYGNSYYIIPN